MNDKFREERYADFRSRADYSPQDVYRHREHGWEYIPRHPFADEPVILRKLGMQPFECLSVDAWWGVKGDATLLQAVVARLSRHSAGIFVSATPHERRWVYVVAVFDAPYITRNLFEAAMSQVVAAGFPSKPQFQLREGDGTVEVKFIAPQ